MLLDTRTSSAGIASYVDILLFIGNMLLLLNTPMLIPIRGQTGTYVLLTWSLMYTHKYGIAEMRTFMGTLGKRLMRRSVYVYRKRLDKYTTTLHLFISDIPRLHQYL